MPRLGLPSLAAKIGSKIETSTVLKSNNFATFYLRCQVPCRLVMT